MNIIDTYNSVGNLSDIQKYIYPRLYIFSVNSKDYDVGYKKRYFVQKINNAAFVSEVDEKNYHEISDKIFIKVNLYWYLTGPMTNVYVNGNIYEQGVYEKNLQEITVAAKSMPSIKNYIKNFTQYYMRTKN